MLNKKDDAAIPTISPLIAPIMAPKPSECKGEVAVASSKNLIILEDKQPIIKYLMSELRNKDTAI